MRIGAVSATGGVEWERRCKKVPGSESGQRRLGVGVGGILKNKNKKQNSGEGFSRVQEGRPTAEGREGCPETGAKHLPGGAYSVQGPRSRR